MKSQTKNANARLRLPDNNKIKVDLPDHQQKRLAPERKSLSPKRQRYDSPDLMNMELNRT